MKYAALAKPSLCTFAEPPASAFGVWTLAKQTHFTDSVNFHRIYSR
ncbi:MAG: hypothetical protein MUO39_10765 [Steroidobacteraceae bacterium]|nr:hypothetical protein [Steroidobacteraceae bacterium]